MRGKVVVYTIGYTRCGSRCEESTALMREVQARLAEWPAWGILRAEYRYRLPKPDRLLRNIGLVVRETRAATGVRRMAYEAAHLFACYPTRS